MNLKPYITDSTASKDGTTIGYRQFGNGPGLILVHGSMMTSQNFMKLATLLSNEFTVYVLDRRGRGLSGPYGDNYSLTKECEDIQAIIDKTGAQNIFGLSSGAIVSLEVALKTSTILKVALYEPPIPGFMSNSSVVTKFMDRYEKDIAKGKLGAALVTCMKGTGDSVMDKLPRFILVPLMTLAMKAEGKEVIKEDVVQIQTLVPTMHYDLQLVAETKGEFQNIKDLNAKVLLLGGSKSQAYLKSALDGLSSALPNAKCIRFPELGHFSADNDEKPELIAKELHQFFRQ
jgi:pimeloyl-ACP methyl ester carboxylesterase